MVVSRLRDIQAQEPLCFLYLFGSVLTEGRTPSDVDVLVVYDDVSVLAGVKQKLWETDLLCPLDVICLSKDEENELQFVRGQRAIPVVDV